MHIQVLGNGEKLINISGNERVRVTSDQHIAPEVMIKLAGHAINGTTPTNGDDRQVFRNRYFIDLLTPPQEGIHQLINGDAMHSFPLIKRRNRTVAPAWDALTQAIVSNGITGNELTIIPGNHTPTGNIPQEDLEQLVNRRVLVPSGRAKIIVDHEEMPSTIMHVRHGDEFDESHNRVLVGDSALAQTLFQWVARVGLGILSSKPFGNNAMKVLSLVSNGPQMVHAEAGLRNGEWAIDGHTHMAGLHPPHKDHLEPEFNLLSVDYLEKLLMDSMLSRLVLKIASRTVKNLSGIDRLYVTSHNGRGYANSGYTDQIAQMLYGLDIDPSGIALFLADVNGGYESDMLKKRVHKSIKVLNRYDLKGQVTLVEN